MQDSISFSAAATKFSDDKATAETGGLFMNQANGSSEIPMENLDFGIFTVIDTMTVGTISSPLPFRTADGKDGMRIIYFKSKKDAHVANLKDDYQKIYAATLAEKKEKQVNKWFFATKNEVFIDVDKEYNQCKITIE
jgi:peptidyl-prolyl cis-trans isomerase SurA